MRVCTEEIGSGIRMNLAKVKPTLLLASTAPEQGDGEASGAAEDGFVGGITGLRDSLSALTGEAEAYAHNVAKANAILSIIKFIATYLFLKGDVRVEEPGQPLIRTTNHDAGQKRTVVAKFWIDGTKVTDWMKDHRKLVALAGLDLDMPKSGALKGVPTAWAVDQNPLVRYKLIETQKNEPDPSNVVTDEKGEATLKWEGAPQLTDLDPKAVAPLEKQARITVTPQVKEIKVQQDLVDAVLGAIGIRGGGTGFLTVLMEMLYRLKWAGSASLVLQVRDWQPADTVGQLSISTRETWTEYTRDSALRWTIDRSMGYTDVGMKVVGGEPPKPIDPRAFAQFPPLIQKQILDGQKQEAEMATKRQFFGYDPGSMKMSINDAKWYRGAEGCDPTETTETTTWNGADNHGYAEPTSAGSKSAFEVVVDLDKKTATVSAYSAIKVKIVTTTTTGKATDTKNADGPMGVFSGLHFPGVLGDGKPVVIPLKETPVLNSNATNYYGAIPIPYTYGPADKFKGTFILSYSITRKVVKPK